MSLLNNLLNVSTVSYRSAEPVECQHTKGTQSDDTSVSGQANSISTFLGGPDSALKLSTVYRCVNVIADTIAQLPIYTYWNNDDGSKKKYLNVLEYNTLNFRPNQRMTRYTFIHLMISSMLLKGAGYAYIKRDNKGYAKELIWIPNEYVNITNPTHYAEAPIYRISNLGIKGDVKATDMIVFINYTKDGVQGLSTIQHAYNTLQLASDSEATAASFFKNGGAMTGILKVQGAVKKGQLTKIKDDFLAATRNQNGGSGGLAVLQGNMDFQTVSINPADQQLLESRKFNTLEICRYFGVSPTKVFENSGTSQYGSLEQSQLSFLTDTIAPILAKLEQELNYKLFDNGQISASFDTSILLRTDKNNLANYYSKMSGSGFMTVNEVRAILDLQAVEGGDTMRIMSNYIPLNYVEDKLEKNTNEEQ